jgi:hypothetical protein
MRSRAKRTVLVPRTVITHGHGHCHQDCPYNLVDYCKLFEKYLIFDKRCKVHGFVRVRECIQSENDFDRI